MHFQVVEGTRRRTQVFEGIVIKRQGSGARETFSVRKQSFGVGVERTFPLHSPKIEQIEVAARGAVRRAKLYYLRDRVGRGARVRERRFTGREEEVYVEGTMPPPEADAPDVPEAAADDVDGGDPRDEGVEEVLETDATAEAGESASGGSEAAAGSGEPAGDDDAGSSADAAADDAPSEDPAPEGEEGSADESRA